MKEDKELYTEKFREQARDFCSRVSRFLGHTGVTAILVFQVTVTCEIALTGLHCSCHACSHMACLTTTGVI